MSDLPHRDYWRLFSPYIAGTRGFFAQIRQSAHVVNVHVAKVLPYSSVTATQPCHQTSTAGQPTSCVFTVCGTLLGEWSLVKGSYLSQDEGQKGLIGSI